MGKKQVRVRDKFWLFASRAHDDDNFFAKCTDKSLRWSRITPTEGAHMLGLSNIIMVASDGSPAPNSHEAYGYLESFCRMDNVMWSVTGSAGFRNGNEEEFICKIADRYPNVCGAFFDDFTLSYEINEGPYDEDYLTDMLIDSRKKLNNARKHIEMWASCYISDAKKYSSKMYDPLDGITVWDMDTDSIMDMEENFVLYEELLPNKKKMLGIYLFDYPRAMSIPDEYMELQCETGLKWLKEGRIEGMVFLTNCVMGIGLPSEYWLREWIDKVGDEILE